MNDELDFFELQGEPEIPTKAKELTPIVPVSQASQNPSESILSLAAKEAGCEITSQEQLNLLNKFIDDTKYGHSSSLPMFCQGGSCPFFSICPLEKAKIRLPVGKPCPVEKSIMGKWISDNIAALGINPDNPEDAVDMNMIAELAGMELIRYRAAWHLSKDPELVEMRVVGYSPQGEPIYDEKPKMSLLILEKYAKVMGKLRDQLLATRRSQAQVGKISNDLSVRAANMQEKARLLAEKRRNKLQEPESKIETDDSEPG
jgi:hypothetical protein